MRGRGRQRREGPGQTERTVSEQNPATAGARTELPSPAVVAVRAAVSGLVALRADEQALRAAVCALAREARERAIAPERLVVCFKTLWAEETAAHPMPDRRAQGALFDQMVTLCIREYFAD